MVEYTRIKGGLIMKKAMFLLTILSFLQAACFAGGPMESQKIGEAKKPTAQLKMIAIDYISSDYFKVNKRFTCGIGFGGSPWVGFVEKDGFGYPKCEYGITGVLGYGYTWISGQPTEKQLKSALDAIRSKNGALIEESKVASMVRQEVGIKELKYVEFGTVALVVPLNFEMGTMWILNDNTRTRLGFGLPTLISFGINFDF
jgi:hypothetical protein